MNFPVIRRVAFESAIVGSVNKRIMRDCDDPRG